MNETFAPASSARYTLGAIILHWLIALLIVLNYVSAWISEDMPKAEQAQVMTNHKAFGLTILLLTVLRIVWRLTHTPPPLVDTLKPWEVALSKVTHGLLYLLMLAMPLSGWIMHSAFSAGASIRAFGLFNYPGLPMAQDKPTAGLFHGLHEAMAWAMLALLALHVAAALKHQFLDRDGTVRRIVPWG